jgi:flagellin
MDIRGVGGGNSSFGSDRIEKSHKKTDRDLGKILKKLSTGLRINQASDDASGLGISEQLRTQIHGFKAASQNIVDASSALSIGEGTGNEVSAMLRRQRDLALQSNSDTLTDEQRKTIDVEYQSLTSEIDRNSAAAQFNTQNVANGQGLASGGAQVQAGANAGEQIRMPGADMTAGALGITGTSVVDRTSAQAALSKIDDALDKLNSQRSTMGSMMNRLEAAGNNLSVAEVNTQAAESVLRDQDMAAGLAEMTRQKLLLETGTQAFSRFNEISAQYIFGLIK